MQKRFLVLCAAVFFGLSQTVMAVDAIDCQVRENACGLSGVYIELPWAADQIPEPGAYAQRATLHGEFAVLYGYEQATGSYEPGTMIIRDDALGVGPYWGFVGRDRTYFAMLARAKDGGWRVGIKGCAEGERVWSTRCELRRDQ